MAKRTMTKHVALHPDMTMWQLKKLLEKLENEQGTDVEIVMQSDGSGCIQTWDSRDFAETGRLYEWSSLHPCPNPPELPDCYPNPNWVELTG